MPIAKPQSVSSAAAQKGEARRAIETVDLAVKAVSSSSTYEIKSETNAAPVVVESINTDENEQHRHTTTAMENDNSTMISQPTMNADSSPTRVLPSTTTIGRRFCATLTFQKDAKQQQKLLEAQQAAGANATSSTLLETQVDPLAHLRTLHDVSEPDKSWRRIIMDDIQRFRFLCGTFVNRPSVQFVIVRYVTGRTRMLTMEKVQGMLIR
jgi:hypothetical protein